MKLFNAIRKLKQEHPEVLLGIGGTLAPILSLAGFSALFGSARRRMAERYQHLASYVERDVKRKTGAKIVYDNKMPAYYPKEHAIHTKYKDPIVLAHEAGHALIQKQYGKLQQIPKPLSLLTSAAIVLGANPHLTTPIALANLVAEGSILGIEYLAWKKGYEHFLKKHNVPKKDVLKVALPALGTYASVGLGAVLTPFLLRRIAKM